MGHSTVLRVNRVLLDHLDAQPPTRSTADAVLRDYYDRAKWVAAGTPLVAVEERHLRRLLRSRRALAFAVVEVWRREPYLRSARDIAERLQVESKALRRVLPDLRAYHLFRIEPGLGVVDGPSYVRVPPGARARLHGRQPVAWTGDDVAIEQMLRERVLDQRSR